MRAIYSGAVSHEKESVGRGKFCGYGGRGNVENKRESRVKCHRIQSFQNLFYLAFNGLLVNQLILFLSKYKKQQGCSQVFSLGGSRMKSR